MDPQYQLVHDQEAEFGDEQVISYEQLEELMRNGMLTPEQ